ncbi:MAG: hypothetical protein Q7K42_02695, partial [Candidatus Diapherotrites archaeon]|nr:hypothetical protein [Candidatus Diapherotrites archaeon]
MLGQTTTNGLGLAYFSIGEMLPNSQIIIEAFKANYSSSPRKKTIELEIVNVDPEELFSEISILDQTEETIFVKLENKISHELGISNALIVGEFKNLLDKKSMQDYLDNAVKNKFDLHGLQTISPVPIVKTKINSAIKDAFPETFKASVYLFFEAKDLKKTWPKRIPLEIQFGQGKGVKLDECIIIEEMPPKWNITTLDKRTKLQFNLYNRCQTGSGKVDLKNLKAKISWIGQNIGQVTTSIYETSSKQEYNNVLVEGEESILLQKLLNSDDSPYQVTMEFNPKSSHIGEKAQFGVEFSAEIQTDTGAKKVSADKQLSADLLVTNLKECVKFTPEPQSGELRIRTEQKDPAEFTLDTTKCGKIPIYFEICDNGKDKCRGVTGEEISGITVTPWKTIDPIKAGTAKFKVERFLIPGQYGIEIKARTSDKEIWQPLTTMDITVEPAEGEYFFLDNYKFNLAGKGEWDSVLLTNTKLRETVSVTAGKCEWDKSQEEPDPFNRTA